MGEIVAAANCSVEAAAGGTWIVTKTGGANGAADSSAVSAAAMAGDFVLRARLLGPGTAYVGVGANPLAAHDGASIERALQISGSIVRMFESGAQRPPFFGLTGFAWLRRIGGTLEYGVGADYASIVVKRSVAGVSGALRFDSSLLTSGLAVEVKFELPAAFLKAARRRPRLSLGLSI
ncbi:MAG TPA: hypothetical protein VHM92_09200 [Allosphingosinicella sp.]|nr:hypothetical protein [Allosphingosinicella sp.]